MVRPPDLAVTLAPEVWSRWHDAARAIDPAALGAAHAAAGVGVVAPGDDAYPAALLRRSRRTRGAVPRRRPVRRRGEPTVSIVGTRRSTGYGEGVAFELGEQLSSAGVSVVSGLALGIDGAAHAGAVVGRGRAAGRGGGERPRRGLPTPQPRAVAGGRAPRLHLVRVAAGCAARAMALPVAQPHHRGARHPCSWWSRARGPGGSMHTVREADDRGRTVMAVPGLGAQRGVRRGRTCS